MSYFPQLYSFTVKFGENIRLLPHFRSIVSALQGIEEKMSDDEQKNAMIILIWVKKVLIQPSIGAVHKGCLHDRWIESVNLKLTMFWQFLCYLMTPAAHIRVRGESRVKRTGVLIVLFRGLKKRFWYFLGTVGTFARPFSLDGVKSHQWQTSNLSKISRFFENIPTSNNMLDRL